MKYLIVNLFVIISSVAFSQTSEIDSLCQEYDKKIQQAIDEELTFEMPRIQIKTTLSKRAIGPVDHEITIYFDEYEVEIGQEGQDVFHKEAVIRKVEFEVESGSYRLFYQYYFDKGGILILYTESEMGYQCVEKSTYFLDKEAIRITQKPFTKSEQPCDEKPESFDKKELTKTEKAAASWLLDEAKKFRELLFLNYEFVKN